MESIVANIIDNKIIIRKIISDKTESHVEEIELELLEYGIDYISTIKLDNKENCDKIFLLQEIDKNVAYIKQNDTNSKLDNGNNNDVVIIYSNDNEIRYSYCSKQNAYKKILKFKHKVLKISLNKKRLKITLLAYLINKYGLKIESAKLYVDQVLGQNCKIKEKSNKMNKLQMLKDKEIYSTFSFNMDDILQDTSEINGSIRMTLEVEGQTIEYRIGKKNKNIKNKRHYYSPIKSKFIKDFAVHIRRTLNGNLVLVKRLKEPIENTFLFKFMESKFVSNILYGVSKILLKIRKKKINLYYEKFSSKAEEGTYDLFLLIRDKNKKNKNYFVIDQNSEDYLKIKHEKNIVKKYNLKYYWLVFNSTNFISTEAPIHLNILRSNNTCLRKSICDKKFIFLQHGITYMKCQGDGSTFAKNKEGEASYIIVGSEKEKNAVIDMLKLDEKQVLNTGLPIFSKIDFKHINNNSQDIVTIMLTWKPYEEQLYNFEESTYYKNTIDIYNMLTKYIDKEKIKIVAHPKVNNLLNSTDIKENIWKGKISEVLNITKLLITDYSSVCYNAFYQGAGVVFYQPDLEKYEIENGKLVPKDDEYIGYRAFDIIKLEEILKNTIKKGKINLNYIRNNEFEERYKVINEFSDGKNIDRIYKKLDELQII